MTCLWCHHSLESSGRDAQTLGEKVRLMEFSVENAGHSVSNHRKWKSWIWKSERA